MKNKSKNCPFCGTQHQRLVQSFHPQQDQPVLENLQYHLHAWTPDQGVCLRCLDAAHQRILTNLLQTSGSETHKLDVLPTPVRMNAHPDYKGKGITICLIDSGFYVHPDLEFPQNRIKKIVDITNPRRNQNYFRQPNENAWHGTMTSVVCAGNGYLSEGTYRGVASEAELVLLKVTDEHGQITEENITKALNWICKNHQKYGIRIVNLSVSGDGPTSFRESEVDKAVKTLHEKGIVVVAAVGNDPHAHILPPANAPEVLAVGGLDDRNTLDPMQLSLYHSTYGWTMDGLLKPELIAPAIWLAAPILPDSPEQQAAAGIFEKLITAKGQEKEDLLQQARKDKFLSAHYQHADGTSFAAPIVCSIIAQMMEANSKLTPAMVREILLTTARPLPYEERQRQGYGVVQAGHAVIQAGRDNHDQLWASSPLIDWAKNELRFRFHYHHAQQVAVSGDFNAWAGNLELMTQTEEGFWEKTIPLPDQGIYQYKYVVDGTDWKSDPLNFYRVPDGYQGFNSQFFI